MVNDAEKVSMKGRILGILRSEKGIVSGEALSGRLGISRVSVWKHIRKLQDCGYRIKAAPTGYRLIGDPDIPYPWEFPGREAQIHYFEQVSSTMDIARDRARKGCAAFTVIVAGRQTKGRGRLDRTWISTNGGLYFTVVVRPPMPPALSARVNFAASLTLVQLLRDMFEIHATVKWPNDILVDGRKLSGMLSEMEAEADRVAFINIGIGLNVNNDPTADEPAAVSLATLMGRQVSKKAILSRYISDFEELMRQTPLDTVISRWKGYTSTLNRTVRVVTFNETTQGTAVDVDDDGALLIQLADGSIRRVVYGDCFHDLSSKFNVQS